MPEALPLLFASNASVRIGVYLHSNIGKGKTIHLLCPTSRWMRVPYRHLSVGRLLEMKIGAGENDETLFLDYAELGRSARFATG